MQIVAISINKVQTFLYHVIRGYSAEQETDDMTLREIQQASFDISSKFIQVIRKEFLLKKEEEILIVSGKAYFYSSQEQHLIQEKLKDLFQYFYLKYKGQVEIRYVYFPGNQDTCNNLHLIHECTVKLKSTACLGNVIADNQEMLFKFPEKKYQSKVAAFEAKCNISNVSDQMMYDDYFVQGLNEFVPPEEAENRKTYRIAIIKADFDKMGQIFQRITNYEIYRGVSTILDEKVSIKHLGEVWRKIEKIFHEGNSVKLFPFYAAGDDLFFAVPVGNIFDGIEMLRLILDEINRELEKRYNLSDKLELSVGINITQNDQPIRYYYERVEVQLLKAKTMNKQNADAKISICFDNVNYFIYKQASKEERDHDWNELIKNIKFLNKARQTTKELSTSYFFNLLRILEDERLNENDITYTNAVFYWLKPSFSDIKTIDKKNYVGELIIKSILTRTLISKRKETGSGLLTYRIDLSDFRKENLKSLVQMFLLFSDKRYCAELKPKFDQIHVENEKYNSAGKMQHVVRSYIAPIYRYIYENNLDGNLADSNLCKVFIRKSTEIKHNSLITRYDKIKLTNSMCFKMKRLLEREEVKKLDREKAIDKIGIMIQRVNEEPVKISGEETVKTYKRMLYCKEAFIMHAQRELTPTYIDSLLLFYQYKYLERLKLKDKDKPKQGQSQNSNRNNNSKNHYKGGTKHYGTGSDSSKK